MSRKLTKKEALPPRDKRLRDFGQAVLGILAAEQDWDSSTLAQVAEQAFMLQLAGVKDHNFTITKT